MNVLGAAVGGIANAVTTVEGVANGTSFVCRLTVGNSVQRCRDTLYEIMQILDELTKEKDLDDRDANVVTAHRKRHIQLTHDVDRLARRNATIHFLSKTGCYKTFSVMWQAGGIEGSVKELKGDVKRTSDMVKHRRLVGDDLYGLYRLNSRLSLESTPEMGPGNAALLSEESATIENSEERDPDIPEGQVLELVVVTESPEESSRGSSTLDGLPNNGAL